jgi:hypothetical protein
MMFLGGSLPSPVCMMRQVDTPVHNETGPPGGTRWTEDSPGAAPRKRARRIYLVAVAQKPLIIKVTNDSMPLTPFNFRANLFAPRRPYRGPAERGENLSVAHSARASPCGR